MGKIKNHLMVLTIWALKRSLVATITIIMKPFLNVHSAMTGIFQRE
jgi:hypothetical protein